MIYKKIPNFLFDYLILTRIIIITCCNWYTLQVRVTEKRFYQIIKCVLKSTKKIKKKKKLILQ